MEDKSNDTPSALKYPLATDANGVPLRVPPEAVAWRVRKLAKRAGRPKILFDGETGGPLELRLDASYDDLCDRVSEPGRYRLEAVDAEGRPIAGCVAVSEVFEDDPGALPLRSTDALPAALQLIGQLVQSNARVMEAMASAFGQVRPAREPIPIAAAPSVAERAGNPLDMIQQVVEILTGRKPDPGTATESGAATDQGDR